MLLQYMDVFLLSAVGLIFVRRLRRFRRRSGSEPRRPANGLCQAPETCRGPQTKFFFGDEANASPEASSNDASYEVEVDERQRHRSSWSPTSSMSRQVEGFQVSKEIGHELHIMFVLNCI